jgi:hypothetical protein
VLVAENSLVPFGKYKGQPVEVIAEDRQYCDWLLEQTWFVQRYPQLHTLVINNFGEPTETPEHNALQIRFLDDTFRAQCTALAFQFFRREHAWEHYVSSWTYSRGAASMFLKTPYVAPPGAPKFEYAGMDLLWTTPRWSLVHDCLQRPHTTTWETSEQQIAVECKPLIGDDYPAILRFLKNLPARNFQYVWCMVVAGAVHSRAVSLEAIKQFFALSHILLVLVKEVEAVTLEHVRRESPPSLDAHATYIQTPGERCQLCLDARDHLVSEGE